MKISIGSNLFRSLTKLLLLVILWFDKLPRPQLKIIRLMKENNYLEIGTGFNHMWFPLFIISTGDDILKHVDISFYLDKRWFIFEQREIYIYERVRFIQQNRNKINFIDLNELNTMYITIFV